MHNWWIASLEYFGLISREEAEHIAGEIKNSIHKENYKENFDELTTILDGAKVKSTPILKKLQNDFAGLKRDVEAVKGQVPDDYAELKKTVAGLVAHNQKVSAAAEEMLKKSPATEVNKTVANATKT